MVKSKRDRVKRQRTSLEIEEEQSRTLYIRIPHTIKNADEIKSLFFGDFKVKLPRQSSRFCHVIFSNVEEKVKNLKAVKKTLIDGKPIFAGPPKPFVLDKKKKPKQKKIVIPEPKEEPKIVKYLFVSNIPLGVKTAEVKDAFPGCVTIGLLKGLSNGTRMAKVKMSSSDLCLQYINKEIECPTLRGKKLSVKKCKTVNNQSSKAKKLRKQANSLKTYGESEPKASEKSQEKQKSAKSKSVKKDEKTESEEDEEDEDEEGEENEDDEDDEDGEVEEDEEDKEEDDEDSNEE